MSTKKWKSSSHCCRSIQMHSQTTRVVCGGTTWNWTSARGLATRLPTANFSPEWWRRALDGARRKNEKWKVQVNNNCSRDCILTSNGVEWRKEEEIRCSIAPRSLITCMICCVWSMESNNTMGNYIHLSRDVESSSAAVVEESNEKWEMKWGKKRRKLPAIQLPKLLYIPSLDGVGWETQKISNYCEKFGNIVIQGVEVPWQRLIPRVED